MLATLLSSQGGKHSTKVEMKTIRSSVALKLKKDEASKKDRKRGISQDGKNTSCFGTISSAPMKK